MEMAKQREFLTLSPTQTMNIWKVNLNSYFAADFSHSVVLIYLPGPRPMLLFRLTNSLLTRV